MSDAIHLPARWEIDTIADACAMLAELTGRDFEPDMLKAAYSGELPADERDGLEEGSGGNLENARVLGRLAFVDWNKVTIWLRKRGYTVKRGDPIRFHDALDRLQQRISPPPTAAELEAWLFGEALTAYVDLNPRRRYGQCDTELLYNPDPNERRHRLWLNSDSVDEFEPGDDRWLTVEQLAQRWGISLDDAVCRLRVIRDYFANDLSFVMWPTNGNCPPALTDDGPFEAMVVPLEYVKEAEKTQGWTVIEAAPDPAPVEGVAKVAVIPSAPAPDKRYVSKQEQQIEHLVSVVKELGYDPMCIPRDTKMKVIMPKCLERPDLFTKNSFSKAWEAANKQGRIRSALAEKTTPSKKGQGGAP